MFVDISWSNNKITPPPNYQTTGWAKNLSDFVTITEDTDKGFEIAVKNEAG
jgi:hypothetical protein